MGRTRAHSLAVALRTCAVCGAGLPMAVERCPAHDARERVRAAGGQVRRVRRLFDEEWVRAHPPRLPTMAGAVLSHQAGAAVESLLDADQAQADQAQGEPAQQGQAERAERGYADHGVR